jgi:Fungal specific transcription factor domain
MGLCPDQGVAYTEAAANYQLPSPVSCFWHVTPPGGEFSIAEVINGSNDTANTQGNESRARASLHALEQFPASGTNTELDHLIDAFYNDFQPAHPFIMPRVLYVLSLHPLTSCLMTVMQFTASHFVANHNVQENFRNRIFMSELPSSPDDGFKVQAMLLLAITLFARFEQSEARSIMAQTIELALRLKMNRWEFSIHAGRGHVLLEESWRRTWWELYTVSCLMTTLSDRPAAWPLSNTQCDVPLPCEEAVYSVGGPVPQPATTASMQDRAFLTEEYNFSSFAYKIDAARLLGTVLSLRDNTFLATDSAVESIDSELSNFLLSLPPGKRELVESDGLPDEVLFTAHMIVNWALIQLHRPRSHLTSGQYHYITACTCGQEGQEPQAKIGGIMGSYVDKRAVHTSKAISASTQLLNAAAVRTPLKGHPPCYTCAVATAAVVLLPTYLEEKDPQSSQGIRSRLQLAINSLNHIGEIWELARAVKIQVTHFANRIFIAPRAL